MIPGFDATGPVPSNSEPLASLEDRQHSHTFTTTIGTDSVEYIGLMMMTQNSSLMLIHSRH